MDKSDKVRESVEQIYRQLNDAGIEVLLDDRNTRAGIMFADMELIGIPHRVVIGERSLNEGMVEYRARTDSENSMIPVGEIVDFLTQKLQETA